jgi:ABC-type uncharacterized transport system involved in gliding motility auxiliary subunit/ABC-type transport system involved in multi-copper enzyme maturation permease subunit
MKLQSPNSDFFKKSQAKLRDIAVMARAELHKLKISPATYIISAVFLLLWNFLFFRSAFLSKEASLRTLFSLFIWLAMILIPALLMGSIAKEKADKTLELVLTHPLDELSFILGKFVAYLVFVTSLLLTTLPLAVIYAQFSVFDWGVYLAQVLGAVLLSSLLIAIGLYVSALLKEQVAALLAGAALSFALVMIGFETVVARLPISLGQILSQVSIYQHYAALIRGVIDTRDVWYFLSAVAVFLSLSYLWLLANKYPRRHRRYRQFQIGTWLLIGISLTSYLVGNRIPGRIDLTQNQIYSLSPVTKKKVRQADDLITVSLYASSKIPAQLQPVLRDTKDILQDYQRFSQGNLNLEVKNPSRSGDVAQEAQSLGIRKVQFNVISNEEFKVKSGYLGVAISYGGQTEVIPFIQDVSQLEYQLTSYIAKLTNPDKPVIKFASGHGEKSQSELSILQQELENQFTVGQLNLASEQADAKTETEVDAEIAQTTPEPDQSPESISQDTDLLALVGPSIAYDQQTLDKISQYLQQGGSLLLLAESVQVNPQLQQAQDLDLKLNSLLSAYGLELKPGLVYDLRWHEQVQLGSGPISYLVPYPLWLRAMTTDQAQSIVARQLQLVLPWVSGVSLHSNTDQFSGQLTPLLTTSQTAGLKQEQLSLDPQQDFTQDNLKQHIVAAASQRDQSKLVLVGDADFATNQVLQSSPANLGFLLEVIAWLTQADSLSTLKLKQGGNYQLNFVASWQPTAIKFGMYGLSVLLPGVWGLLVMLRRHRLQQQVY